MYLKGEPPVELGEFKNFSGPDPTEEGSRGFGTAL
jgi:hypothetical protein